MDSTIKQSKVIIKLEGFDNKNIKFETDVKMTKVDEKSKTVFEFELDSTHHYLLSDELDRLLQVLTTIKNSL